VHDASFYYESVQKPNTMWSCNNSHKNGSLHEAAVFFSEHVASQLDSVLVLEKMGG
jgi:hypothetical protein